jgi:hypothetical protein
MGIRQTAFDLADPRQARESVRSGCEINRSALHPGAK